MAGRIVTDKSGKLHVLREPELIPPAKMALREERLMKLHRAKAHQYSTSSENDKRMRQYHFQLAENAAARAQEYWLQDIGVVG